MKKQIPGVVDRDTQFRQSRAAAIREREVAKITKALCEAAAGLAERGLIVAREGNVTALLPGGEEVLGTAAGSKKGEATPGKLVRCDRQGNKLDGVGRVSTEIRMHLALYERRPDIAAVVHAHPKTATAFAAAGLSLDPPVLAETVAIVGRVALAEYHPPGSPELAAEVAERALGADAVLLANHGAVTVGRDPTEAFERMETLERSAEILLAARRLGGARPLPEDEVERLVAARRPASPSAP